MSKLSAQIEAITVQLQADTSPFVEAIKQSEEISRIFEIGMFTDAYIECALWSSMDDDGNPLDDNYDVHDLAPETLDAMRKDCGDFFTNHSDLIKQAHGIRYSYESPHAGHDFWLTRNGHGAGFWDRGLGEVGDRLSDAAEAYGGSDLYIGDDGLIYAS